MFIIQYDKTGRFRLLHHSTQTRSAWMSYQEVARVQVGGKTFLAQVGADLLPKQEQVYAMIAMPTTIEGVRQGVEEEPPTTPDLRKSSPWCVETTPEREAVRRKTPAYQLRKIQPRIFHLFWRHRMERPQEIRGYGTDQLDALTNAFDAAGLNSEESLSQLHHWEEKVG
jgi:hypothetical protein